MVGVEGGGALSPLILLLERGSLPPGADRDWPGTAVSSTHPAPKLPEPSHQVRRHHDPVRETGDPVRSLLGFSWPIVLPTFIIPASHGSPSHSIHYSLVCAIGVRPLACGVLACMKPNGGMRFWLPRGAIPGPLSQWPPVPPYDCRVASGRPTPRARTVLSRAVFLCGHGNAIG